MLTAKDEQNLKENIRNFYQLADYNSQIFGEPFILNDYLYYFDGFKVTIITPRIVGEITSESVNDTITEIIQKHKPDDLVFWGQTPKIDITEQAGYEKYFEALNPTGHEMTFKTRDFLPTKKYNKLLKKADDKSIKTKIVQLSHYKSEYTKLLTDIHEGILKARSISYYSIYPKIDSTKFIEIRKTDQLIAVIIVIEALPNYICLAEIGYDKNFKDSGGIAIAKTIDQYVTKARYISLGGSAREGIYKYKKSIIGEISDRFYEKSIWCEFYKTKEHSWWLTKMAKG